MRYYTPLIILCWITLAVLAILVKENNRIPNQDKRILYLAYAVTAFAALAEWMGVQLNGNADIPEWILRAVKFRGGQVSARIVSLSGTERSAYAYRGREGFSGQDLR